MNRVTLADVADHSDGSHIRGQRPGQNDFFVQMPVAIDKRMDTHIKTSTRPQGNGFNSAISARNRIFSDLSSATCRFRGDKTSSISSLVHRS